MGKPRNVTLGRVREVLKAAGRTLTDDELAAALGCGKPMLREVRRWMSMAVGVRCVRSGGRKWLGWSYVPARDSHPYEPATATIESLEERIAELQRENERLRRALPIDE